MDEKSMEVLRLWSLGVGSVIGGDFFGWNSCLRGGFGAGILSVVWAAVLYSLLARCVGRLCSLLPKSQGSYSFVNVGLGPRYSVVVAACETVKLFWVLSALGFGIVEYFFKVVHISHSWQYGLYMFLVLCFCCLGLGGVKNLGNGQFIVTVSCLAILMFYWISAVEHFNFRKYAIPGDEWFRSWDRVLESLPFGAWFFIGFEELPLLAPHSMGAKKRAKVLWRGLLLSFFTVMSSCILTFTIASGSNPGVSTLRSEEAPLLEGMEIAYGDDSKGATSFAVLSVLALLAPFCSFFLYCTYHLQEIAEGKMIPEFISNVNHRRIPTYALVVTSITNFCLLSVFGFLFGIDQASEVVIPGCLVAALISAFLQLEALHKVQQNFNTSGTCDITRRLSDESVNQPSAANWINRASTADVSLFEIRFGQAIIVFILGCIIVLACRNRSHLIGLAIVISCLIVLSRLMRKSQKIVLLETGLYTGSDM